eukprot:TRINITY_DN32792_c0_g1_i1.p1 TRINITY_DN32792_c0_g1~~TRINITY_DN32792_c0_g1_i1.p1  ORF type:complete len:406 (+),score=134.72 TRINITY_DN32792_c0_g1_i1:29-1246(+)
MLGISRSNVKLLFSFSRQIRMAAATETSPSPTRKRLEGTLSPGGITEEAKETRRRRGDNTPAGSAPMKNVLVTGGLGFIGSNFINYFCRKHPSVNIYNLDWGDYVSNEKNVDEEVCASGRYTLITGDIANRDLVMHLFTTHQIDTIINFAAQTHVDNSFGNSMCFTRTNVLGTHNLLECSKAYGKIEKFVHVSTDEVYGEVEEHQKETALLNPTNPYAATKAAAEFIVKAYRKSFDLPVVITRGNNVYGPRQYPEKVIPRFIWLLHQDKKMTIQGSGKQQRTFVHCEDAAKAYAAVVEEGVLGSTYNIGTEDERSVLDIAKELLVIMKGPDAKVDEWIETVPDRDFNDFRYMVDTSELTSIGWNKEVEFGEGLRQTVDWYKGAFERGHWEFINPEIGRPPPHAKA